MDLFDLVDQLRGDRTTPIEGDGHVDALVLDPVAGTSDLDLCAAKWVGTPALTHRRRRVAASRLFVLGDAAGYVEPLTGEGIGWALASAVQLAPLALDATRGWRPQHASAWARRHRALTTRAWRRCHVLTRCARWPAVFQALARLALHRPGASSALVDDLIAMRHEALP